MHVSPKYTVFSLRWFQSVYDYDFGYCSLSFHYDSMAKLGTATDFTVKDLASVDLGVIKDMTIQFFRKKIVKICEKTCYALQISDYAMEDSQFN